MVLKLKFKYIIVCIIILVNLVFLIFFNISDIVAKTPNFIYTMHCARIHFIFITPEI